MTSTKEIKAYNEGYEEGKKVAFQMKQDADGCVNCAFEDVEPWQLPCDRCKRNCKDYWRAKEGAR